MNLKTIKKELKHSEIIENGYKLNSLSKGYFKINGEMITTLVFQYKKERYCNNLLVGYFVKYYNRFGLIYECQE